ncbi:MAG: NADH-quinone oxidoreductase subunit NuoG [Burkholderiales bacterium]
MTGTVKIEVDGNPVEVPNGTMVMEAANKLGIYVPHFCWHKKLSIAANCRMCLVQVEKAPKPLPACATPVTDGMKVWTQSPGAKQAQRAVMEFLLINHPLDCPICDQGGECQLQDLAVGYGGSASRYDEPKRVVPSKEIGPLVAAEEMSRCIQCTRCVRFGQEIAGVMELGMANRGEHSEIVSFVGRTVDSELSGNMIDVCPVGALTSKPFRYTARTWELARRRSVSPHDGLGSNLIVQAKQNRVMRVLPLENEEVNECWLSDKDRFSYEALNVPDRAAKPIVRVDGTWREADWPTALELVATRLREIAVRHGGPAIGALASPHATLEELHLTARLMRGLGSDNVDFRLRQRDFSADALLSGAPWLGMKVAELSKLDRVLVVGSFLRKDHPLLAARFRVAAHRGQQVNVIHLADDDLLIPMANKAIVRPSALPALLAQVVVAAAAKKGVAAPPALAGIVPSRDAESVAASLASGQNVGLFLGNAAQHHPHATQMWLLVQTLGDILGARFGFLGEAANSVGGYLAGAVPATGLNATAMLANPRKAYVLLNTDVVLDTHDPAQARAAMEAAEFVVALSTFDSQAADYADVILPIGAFTETSGTFVNTEGRVQAINGVVRPVGDARPAWKVLRVLGTMLGLSGFDFDTSEQVRDAIGGPEALAAKLANRLEGLALDIPAPLHGVERVADVPIHFADSLVRRAPSLQQTADARAPRARMNAAMLAQLRIAPGAMVRVTQGVGAAVLEAAQDDGVPAGCVRVAAAHPATAGLGPMYGELAVERT